MLPASQQLQNTSMGTDVEITTDKFRTRPVCHKEQVLWTNVTTDVNNNVQKTVTKQKRWEPERMNGLTALELPKMQVSYL